MSFYLVSGAEETDDSMSSTTLTSPSVHEKTPIINISQVSIDGQDMDVAMRPKKTPSRTKNSEDINANTPPRSTIANRYYIIITAGIFIAKTIAL